MIQKPPSNPSKLKVETTHLQSIYPDKTLHDDMNRLRHQIMLESEKAERYKSKFREAAMRYNRYKAYVESLNIEGFDFIEHQRMLRKSKQKFHTKSSHDI